MNTSKNGDYIKTNVGILYKEDLNVWLPYYRMYVNEKSLRKIGEELGVSYYFLSDLFFKKFKLDKKINRKAYQKDRIKTSVGYLNKNNLDDWLSYYERHAKGEFLIDLANELKIGTEALTNVFFNFLKLDRIDNTKFRMAKIEKSNIENLGVSNVFSLPETVTKIKKAKKVKYGDENYNNLEKALITKETRYGDKNYNNRNKAEQTTLETYGVTNYNKSDEGRTKLRNSVFNLKIEGIMSNIKEANLEFLDIYRGVRDSENKSIHYKFRCIECSEEFTSMLEYMPRCPKCKPKRIFHKQNNLAEYIKNLGFKVELNYKLESKKEIDIYIPSLKIGFEYNGSYWHSGLFKGRNYHQDKSKTAMLEGIFLYHIWDYFDEDIVTSKIRNILGKTDLKLKARKLKVREVSSKEQKKFLNENHLHGYKSSTFAFGLYKDDEIVSLISFVKNKSNTIQLVRFCNKKNLTIYQAFNVLLKRSIEFIKTNYTDINKIVTFAYRDWTPNSQSNVYITNRFKLVNEGLPSLYYFNNRDKKVYNRENYMKKKLKEIFPENYSDDLTEREILELNDIYPLYDSGTFRYELDV